MKSPAYLGRFLDDCQARTYFESYIAWYNLEHYHSGMDYVTPEQAHQGLRDKIVAQREAKKTAQRLRRWTENKKIITQSTKPKSTINRPATKVA